MVTVFDNDMYVNLFTDIIYFNLVLFAFMILGRQAS